MNFDTDVILLPEVSFNAASASPQHAVSNKWKWKALALTTVIGLASTGVAAKHLISGKSPVTTFAAPSVKLGTLMPLDTTYTPKRMTGDAAMSGIHLTFDDGPHPKYTPALLDWLKTNRIQATFFLVGSNAERYPELVKRIAAEGHQIGNHTWSHPNLMKLPDAKARLEIRRTHEVITKVTGRAPTLFRPPYGLLKDSQREWLTKEYRYQTVLWDVDTEDWKSTINPAVITQRIERDLKPGVIILAHDIHPRILQALQLALPRLQTRGLKPASFAPISGRGVQPALVTR